MRLQRHVVVLDAADIDFDTKVGGARLCSGQGEIAQRFHLLLHGIAGVLAAAVAAALFHRTRLISWWPQRIPRIRPRRGLP